MQQDAEPSTCPEEPPDSTFTINRVIIRVLCFWPEKPAVWFVQLKGQFALSNVTNHTTQFHYIISKLDNTHIVELENVITNPHPQAAMTVFKQN